MIKILRIVNRFNLGGPIYNATFLSAYVSAEFETLLLGGKHEEHEGDSQFIPLSHGVQPQIIEELQREINFKQDRKAIKLVRQLIRSYQPDIVHTHASKAGAIGRYAAYKEGVPVIVHTFHGHVFHSYFGKVKTFIYKVVERYLAKKTNAIVAISATQKNELVNKYRIVNSEKVHVIPLGFDLKKFQENKEVKRQIFRTKHQVNSDELAIGIIGRLTSIKNHNGFLQAVQVAASKTTKNLVVFIVGDGELRSELENQAVLICESIPNLRIIFTSWIKEIDSVLPALDLVALSSWNEGTPVSLIEAQAAGVPVISTNVGGVKDIVIENETGIIVDSFEVQNYALGLLDLIENEEKRKKMSQNGWTHVQHKFHYKRLCRDVENLYLELLNKKKGKK